MTAYGALMTAGYRADNLRAWKQNASGKTYYYYAGGTPLFETDSSGNVTAINVFSPDGLTARQQSGNWIYYTFDQQGNVAQRLDAGQNVLSNGSYDSYGAGAASPSGDPSATTPKADTSRIRRPDSTIARTDITIARAEGG